MDERVFILSYLLRVGHDSVNSSSITAAQVFPEPNLQTNSAQELATYMSNGSNLVDGLYHVDHSSLLSISFLSFLSHVSLFLSLSQSLSFSLSFFFCSFFVILPLQTKLWVF